MSPRLSIITPSLNQRGLLASCIRRVQDFGPAVEQIVCDGGSSDGSVEVCEKAKAQHPSSFRFQSQKDGGIYPALNTGFEMAEGDIYGWLNCDDILFPWTTDIVLQTFDENPNVDFIYGDNIEDFGSRVAFTIHPSSQSLKPYSQHGGFLAQPAVFFRKRAFLEHGPLNTELNLLADHHLFRRMIDAGRTKKVWEFLSVQQQIPGQLMQRYSEKVEDERELVNLELLGRSDVSRRPADILASGLRRLAISIFAAESSGVILRKELWARFRAAGYLELVSKRRAWSSLIRSTRRQKIFSWTPKARDDLGLLPPSAYEG